MLACSPRERPTSNASAGEGGSAGSAAGSSGAGGTTGGALAASGGSAGAAGGASGAGGWSAPECTAGHDIGAHTSPGKLRAIRAGEHHTCAVFDTGALRCWGANAWGQLGYGTTVNVGDGNGPSVAEMGNVPVGCAVDDVALGFNHTCALLAGGAVRCWGFGGEGRLGYGQQNPVGGAEDSPSIVDTGDVPVGGLVTAITAGRHHTCARLQGGVVRCWGRADKGQLGYNSVVNVGDGVFLSIIDAGDVPVGGPVASVSAGTEHTCAVLETGAVRCWGRSAAVGYHVTENVGDGDGMSIVEAGDLTLGASATDVASGGFHSCALMTTGSVRCWGPSEHLGYGDSKGYGINALLADAGDVPIGGNALALEAGDAHTCALLETGNVRCWGYGDRGQLGYENPDFVGRKDFPSIVEAGDVNLGVSSSGIAVGGWHNCVTTTDNQARCWGHNDHGQLGGGSTTTRGASAGDMPPPSLALD